MLILIALGGALGSILRAVASYVIPAGRLPWGTIGVNVAGSLFIGVLMARYALADPATVRAHSFWVVGVCGGFTTFSAFSWQTVALLQKGNYLAAIANVCLSVVVCLVATGIGLKLGR